MHRVRPVGVLAGRVRGGCACRACTAPGVQAARLGLRSLRVCGSRPAPRCASRTRGLARRIRTCRHWGWRACERPFTRACKGPSFAGSGDSAPRRTGLRVEDKTPAGRGRAAVWPANAAGEAARSIQVAAPRPRSAGSAGLAQPTTRPKDPCPGDTHGPLGPCLTLVRVPRPAIRTWSLVRLMETGRSGPSRRPLRPLKAARGVGTCTHWGRSTSINGAFCSRLYSILRYNIAVRVACILFSDII
jgi:hypothetical protein